MSRKAEERHCKNDGCSYVVRLPIIYRWPRRIKRRFLAPLHKICHV